MVHMPTKANLKLRIRPVNGNGLSFISFANDSTNRLWWSDSGTTVRFSCLLAIHCFPYLGFSFSLLPPLSGSFCESPFDELIRIRLSGGGSIRHHEIANDGC